MALSQNPRRKSVPHEAIAQQLISSLFVDAKHAAKYRFDKSVIDALSAYADSDEEGKNEGMLAIARALISCRIASLCDDDLKNPSGTPVERIARIKQRLLYEMVVSQRSTYMAFINQILPELLDKKSLERDMLARDLRAIAEEKKQLGSAESKTALPKTSIEATRKTTNRGALQSLMAVPFIVGGVLGGVSLSDRFFSANAMAEGGVMEGQIPDSQFHTNPLLDEVTEQPQAQQEAPKAVAHSEEIVGVRDDHYEVRLLKTPAGETMLDAIRWVGKGVPPIQISQCSPVYATPVDSEVVGLECPYNGHTVTFPVLRSDVDEESRKWQLLPFTTKAERK